MQDVDQQCYTRREQAEAGIEGNSQQLQDTERTEDIVSRLSSLDLIVITRLPEEKKRRREEVTQCLRSVCVCVCVCVNSSNSYG